MRNPVNPHTGAKPSYKKGMKVIIVENSSSLSTANGSTSNTVTKSKCRQLLDQHGSKQSSFEQYQSEDRHVPPYLNLNYKNHKNVN